MVQNNAMTFADQPSATMCPANIKNKNVIIMDVAYNYNVLKKIVKNANYVLHIDHHVTNRNDMIKLQKEYPKKLELIYDVHECGSSLTWKYINKKMEIPLFIKYIHDNDIGKWEYEETLPFITSINVHYPLIPDMHSLELWESLFDDKTVEEMINMGKIYQKYEKHLLEKSAKQFSVEQFPSKIVFNYFRNEFNKVGEYVVVVINGSGCPSNGMVTKKILESTSCDFVIMWTLNFHQKQYVLSFRSKTVDVGRIAQLFGGGGHKYASACSISVNKFNIIDLFE
jgi:oligoribonuclease NrnB/cAMP/cGMP phosphodiesterase (DHH superfamily)